MLFSMTGFATKTFSLTNKDGSRSHVTMSLKSLNSRFFEANCKLPAVLSHLENDCIKKLKEKLVRGYALFSLQLSNPNIFKGPIEPDMSIATSYLAAMTKLQDTFDIQGPITIHDLIGLPNIFNIQEQALEEDMQSRILDALEELIDALIKTRKQEGKALQADLQKRLKIVAEQLEKIKERAQQFMEERKSTIVARLTNLDQNQEVADTQRNLLYFELDKIDIHEEIVRFTTHLKAFEQHLQSEEIEKGRRLDFILQELAREINTITAKCSDSTISSHAINIKVELEKAREQVQNIV